MKWKIASASARGTSHVRSGRPNQDACEYGSGSPGSHLKGVVAVSDGHGGARHFRSEIGSRLAAHIAVCVIQDSLPVDLPDEAVPVLTQQMVEDWRTAVLSDLQEHPFTSEELDKLEAADKASVQEDSVLAYGATLLVVAASETCILYLQLGDGDILAVDAAGQTSRPLPFDDRLVGNQTTSLCQPEAWHEFRAALVRNPAEYPVLVLASTDGYANSFRAEEDFLKIGGDYLNLLRADGLDVLAEDLPNILAEASEKGSGDDITLSVLVSDAAYAAPGVLAERFAPEYARSLRPTAEYKAAEHVPEESAPAAPRFSTGQIRIMVLLAIVMVGAFLIQHFARLEKKTEGVTAAPAPKDTNAAPQGKEWVLHAGTKSIPLRPGSKITTSDLFGTEERVPYAEIVKDNWGVLQLVNLSNDSWTGVALSNGGQITLGNGTVATIALADVTPN